MRRFVPLAFALSALALAVACGSDDDSRFRDGSQNDGGGGDDGVGNGGLGDPDDTPASDGGTGNCTPNLTGLVRDFREWNEPNGNPDFQHYAKSASTQGLVEEMLGEDQKPVFKASGTGNGGTPLITNKASFDEWYRNTTDKNVPIEFVLPLRPIGGGVLQYDNDKFFPIDGKGFGNKGAEADGTVHNFNFTFELHVQFIYRGGEKFTFKGDDDLWAFFNKKLGVDLGGLHNSEERTVELDTIATEFGLQIGQVYPLDVFHAERSTQESHFRIDTTLEFVNCEPILLPR